MVPNRWIPKGVAKWASTFGMGSQDTPTFLFGDMSRESVRDYECINMILYGSILNIYLYDI